MGAVAQDSSGDAARRDLAILAALFFCSGACGVTYQVLWLRLLALVFGVTTYAATTVLAAFMTGLAAGSILAGALLRRIRRPLLIFGVAEIVIALTALATPFQLEAAASLYERLHPALSDGVGVLTPARFVVSFLVLFVPTALMGLTLPVLSASRVVRGAAVGSRLGTLYAVNTLGAMAGAALTGFVLIGGIGMRRSFLLAASLNVAVGVAALLLWRRHAASDEVTPSVPEPSAGVAPTLPVSPVPPVPPVRPLPPAPRTLGLVLTGVVAVSGAAALALEVIWFRMLTQFLDATTYAFSTMLVTVLAGIGAGGAAAARLLRRDRDWTAWLSGLQFATAIAVVGSSAFLSWSYAAGWTSSPAQASAAAMLPATLLMGLSFPIALRASLRGDDLGDGAARGRRVGRMYAANVGGAVAGAVLAGFGLLPWLGTRRALIAAAFLYVVAGLLLLLVRPRARALPAAAVWVALFAVVALRVPDPFAAAFDRRHGPGMQELWRHDGVQAAVSVRAGGGRRSMFLDGIHQANDAPDMVRLHRTIGHLPMVLHPSPADVLVVGLGGGATAGAVSRHPAARIQVVELSEGVRRAAGFFAHVNHDVLRDPDVRLRVDDGRNFLRLSGERFDVITADIIQPHHAGAGHLYSREYFQLVRGALRENGLAVQWTGPPSAGQYRLVMRTFLSVFPDATLWCDGELMIGALGPLRVDPAVFARWRAEPETRAALDEIGLSDFAALTAWYTAGPEEMRRFLGKGPVLTDDQPRVEYFRSLPRRPPPLDRTTLRGDVRPLIAR